MRQHLRYSFLCSAIATFFAGESFAALPVNSAYLTDPQSSYVQDATSDSIGQVNMITCIMSSMRPDALVNQGPYIALVDKNKCDSEKSSSSNAGANSGATQAPDYIQAVVDSTRVSNTEPMQVHAWLSLNEDNGPITIFIHISASEAPSASNPYGAFRIDYCGKPGGSGECVINGFMQGGSGALSYFETGGGGEETTALQLTSVGTSSGSGAIALESNGGGNRSGSYSFAYDQNYFLRSDTQQAEQCFSRDASDPATGLSVWRYGLYDADTGARIERDSGFPIQYTSNGVQAQGFVGYFGMSLAPDAPTLADGAAVQKVTYENGAATATDYTVSTKAGRLTRYTRHARTLHSIDQIHFNAFINNATSFGLPDSNANYEMYWDEATAKFIVSGEQMCNQNGCVPVTIDPISLDPTLWANQGGIQGWSQSLGGDLFVGLAGITQVDSANITVVYHVQDLVYPDDVNMPAALYCASNCPTAASMQAYFQQGDGGNVDSPYVPGTFNRFNPALEQDLVAYHMGSGPSSGLLLDGSDAAAVDTNASDFEGSQQYMNGLMSGRLFVNLSDAQCNPQGAPVGYCDYQVNQADVYYVWQTGPSSWNQFAAIKNSDGQFVHFDAPLNVSFSVPSDPGFGAYANTSLILQYGGFGDLWGIPGVCVSPDTNAEVECNTPNARFVPQFVIPFDGTGTAPRGVVTDTSSGVSKSYLVKWLEREIRFAIKDPSVCAQAQLQAPADIQLPTAAQLKDTTDSASDVFIGAEPEVTAAPRVIQGDVKY